MTSGRLVSVAMRQSPRSDLHQDASSDVLLFDFGGTLDADGLRWSVRFHHAYAAAGGSLAFESFEPFFCASDQALERLVGIRNMDLRQMAAAQATVLLSLLPDGQALDADRIAMSFHAETLAAVEHNRPLLTDLAARHRLGIVSNFTGNLHRCLDELALAPLFSAVMDSAVVGCSKPDPRIFQQALAALGAAPSDAWMIGDNFETDIRPAAALGLRTCWIAPAERPWPTENVGTARIARLVELSAVLR